MDGADSWRLGIGHVACDHGHVMCQFRCRDEGVALSAPVGQVQPGTALRNSGIDGQRVHGEFGQDVLIQPRLQEGTLRSILACHRQDARLQFHDGDGGRDGV